MAMRDYERLIEHVCAATGLDAERLLSEGTLRAGETPVRLQYFSPADLCRLEIDLGRPPSCGDADALRWMLECNTDCETGCLPVLAIDPDSGNALVYLHFPLCQPDSAEALLRFLESDVQEMADQWRRAEVNHDAGASSGAAADLLAFA
ncbi:MAG: Tir chaperone protein (CesT) family protein [Herminiimonas sp.]|nr:Tir chaperone protein (CesT) family protein [Herminiimonas sp.]